MVVNDLRRLRLRAGLSQRRVAEELHLSQSAVSRWEVGSASPGLAVINCLAALYGVSADVIIECKNQNKKVV